MNELEAKRLRNQVIAELVRIQDILATLDSRIALFNERLDRIEENQAHGRKRTGN